MTPTQIENPLSLSIFRFENFFTVYSDTEKKLNFYNLLKNISIFPANDTSIETEYIVKPNDTWVLISWKHYNTMELWWVICEYNQIKNPTKMPNVGEKIKILTSSYIHSLIVELEKQLKK